MEASMAALVVGSTVLLFAGVFVAGHYRREHRRSQILRKIADCQWRAHRFNSKF
jgi:hypothetical protein